jgi:hypothetical protein
MEPINQQLNQSDNLHRESTFSVGLVYSLNDMTVSEKDFAKITDNIKIMSLDNCTSSEWTAVLSRVAHL